MAQRVARGEAPEPKSEFHRVGLRPASYILRGAVAGKAPALAGPFELAEGQLERDVILEVSAGARIVGQVTDAQGRPVQDAFVWLGAESADAATRLAGLDETLLREDPRWLPRCAKTDRRGAFRFEHLPAGLAYRLGVLHHDRQPRLGEALVLQEGEEHLRQRLPAGPGR